MNDDEYWRRLGAESGRRNEPRIPDGSAPVRTLLQTGLTADLRAERIEFLDALEALDARRATVRRQLYDAFTQAQSDPRQASGLSVLRERDQTLLQERAKICDQFLEVIDSIEQRGGECDALWRAENERHRSRRLAIAPTDLAVSAGIRDIPADPLS